jgi:hypothetical protein
MKIVLNKQETLDIVLAAIKNKVADELNDITLERYDEENFITIRYVEPTFEESDK